MFFNLRLFSLQRKKLTLSLRRGALRTNPFRLFTNSMSSINWAMNEKKWSVAPRDVPSSDSEKADLFASYFEKEIFTERLDYLPFHAQISKQVEAIKVKLATEKDKNKFPRVTA